ncbi:acyl CoA binding domain containing protein [Nitzschia inconspicua]|uniref:Acyl CoA binding domain containing protein n=1 Tax=Nitzschia inconspicua TaxID=303405 RepID=A0A9K3LWB0_9STRA|nr:acyl CoA binding domain containing protein [Nitzschia inconspicua]
MTAGESELTATFRAKANFMKTWKPASTPSNRDRLELYALHKVAVSGDAPSSLPSSVNAAERAKYQAWRSKSGISQEEAMKLYLQEADRQMRVYGSTNGITSSTSSRTGSAPQTPQTTPNTANGSSTGAGSQAANTPRGLAAIPLLCAAAAESRPAYLRRLSQTPLEAGWWQRQEPLCSSPGTIGAIPENILLMVARFVEHVSLTTPGNLAASFFWPFHNTLLGLWMMIILYITVMKSMLAIVAILVWGTRRTGISLTREWDDTVPLVGQSISAMVERHQALTSRLIGLIMLPLPTIVNFYKSSIPNMTVSSSLFVVTMVATWWYWFIISPILMSCILWTALASGACFALIEFAGV